MELGATEEDMVETLIGKRTMRVRDIRTFHLFIPIRDIYYVVQHTVLPRSGNTDVMIEIDQIIMFCLMTKRGLIW